MSQKETKEKNVINKSCFIPFRKYGFRSSMSATERARLIEMKAQMEQQIQVLDEQIYLEEIKLLARNNKPQQLFKASR